MDDQWLTLTRALAQIIRAHAPEWTDRNLHDPGVTMLEFFAYVAEGLRFHGTPSDERASAAARAIEQLEPLTDREAVAVRINGEKWQRVDSLDDAEADARVFTFDPSSSEITFGDGVHGQAPDPGALVTVRYRDGSGGEGNTITARTTWRVSPQRFSVSLIQRGCAGASTSSAR